MEKEYYDLTTGEVNEFMASRKEGSYQLLDVRFEEEYVEEHIPGAIHIPLDQLEQRMIELSTDRDVIVYCLSGKRSVTASVFIGSWSLFQGKVYNLTGGILTWKDMCLPDMPQIKVFELSGGEDELLYQAMNLEKGAHNFYQQIVLKFGSAPYIKAIMELVHAEVKHAAMIYFHWAKTQDSPPPFEQVYESLPGDILEGGKSMTELTAILEESDGRCTDILEMAMLIEFTAYDLYRNMAHLKKGTEMEEVFLSLSQSEKSHMRIATEALALCR